MTATRPVGLRASIRWVAGLGTAFWVLACGSGLPELRPGMLDSPSSTATHGRIVEKTYKRSNGPQTITYKILEVDGSPVRIRDGFVERTSYATVAGVDAVGFTVRGPEGVSGIYVLQLDGSGQILERLCDYGALGSWDGPVFRPGTCKTRWDAKKKKRA